MSIRSGKIKKINSPILRYHGAKFRLADWIMSFFPEHSTYVEPFGGAAGVLIQKPRSYSEVYNDLDSEISNVFRVLRDPAQSKRLAQLCALTPYSRDEFEESYTLSNCPIDNARKTIYRASAGFGSASATKGRSGFRIDSSREYNTASHLWAQYPDKIAAFCERLQGVLIENRPAIDVITQHDSADTLFFVDPPYMMETRVAAANKYYRHEMDEEQHKELLDTLIKLDGLVVLSGYYTELYNQTLTKNGWERHEKNARISANRGTGTRVECVWLNPKTVAQQSQRELFK